MVQRIKGSFPFNQNFRKFGNSGKWYINFPDKFPEIPETVEFPKCEPFKRKFYLEIPGAKINGKFLEDLKNAVPFATGSCQKSQK